MQRACEVGARRAVILRVIAYNNHEGGRVSALGEALGWAVDSSTADLPAVARTLTVLPLWRLAP
jgi:hypothetical protein